MFGFVRRVELEMLRDRFELLLSAHNGLVQKVYCDSLPDVVVKKKAKKAVRK